MNNWNNPSKRLFGSYSLSRKPGIAGRTRIMTSLFLLETKMVSCSGESVEAVERRKGFWWSSEDILLLISKYREHEKLFRTITCKKKSVWELITASMAAKNPNFSTQVEGEWKSLTLTYCKCCDQNNIVGNDQKECPFYREIAEFYGYRTNVCLCVTIKLTQDMGEF